MTGDDAPGASVRRLIRACDRAVLARPDGAWRMTGVDSQGTDLRLGGETARLEFAHACADADAARGELVRLAARAETARR